MKAVFSFLLRMVLLLAGLIFLASLLLAGALLFVLWLIRALWARVTGQPVSPWTFQINRQALRQRFYRSPGQGANHTGAESDVIDAEVKEIKPPV